MFRRLFSSRLVVHVAPASVRISSKNLIGLFASDSASMNLQGLFIVRARGSSILRVDALSPANIGLLSEDNKAFIPSIVELRSWISLNSSNKCRVLELPQARYDVIMSL